MDHRGFVDVWLMVVSCGLVSRWCSRAGLDKGDRIRPGRAGTCLLLGMPDRRGVASPAAGAVNAPLTHSRGAETPATNAVARSTPFESM